jgi:hypothetical protein
MGYVYKRIELDWIDSLKNWAVHIGRVLVKDRPEDPKRIEPLQASNRRGDNPKKGREGRETAGSDGSWERRRSSAIAAPLDLLLAPLHPISSSSWCRSYLLLVPLLVVARAPELRRPRSGRAAPAKKAKIRSAPYSDGPKVSIHSIPLFFLMCPCLKL